MTTWVEGVTALGPTNMNHLETGVSNVTTTADAAIPAPIGPASNAGLVWNGSSWVAATIVNANVNAAAAIAYSKLNLAGGIVNNDVSASAAIAQSKLADGPGKEVGYDQITSNVAIVSTTESSGTTVISCSAHAFDGAAVLAEFFCPVVSTPDPISTTPVLIISLFEGATQIGRLAQVCIQELGTGQIMFSSVCAKIRFTPTAANHTYTVTAHVSSTTGSPTINSGAGGTATFSPTYVRFTKV